MLSRDGRCKSFGDGGNGFVPGEGAGAVLLKSLSKAVEDRDHIYAVIRATAINHGGKTNGYTVPNPVAQGEVIRAALDKAGVNARTVSYIEAHGTGTELGDPIEITGLSQAFGKDTHDTCYCAIGSVKSNIGHLEAAAGIAGIVKIVLQMKHKKLVPSLHSKKLNQNINFQKTPFVVQQELTEWKRPIVEINGEKKEYPRIAGISSFGAGGSNAHAIIEEYVEKRVKDDKIEITPQKPALIVISARNEDRLREQVERLLAVVRSRKFTESDLAGIAYTLQVGREAMEERLAFTASSMAELQEKLEGFLEGRINIPDLYRGQAKRNKETLVVLAADDDMEKIVDTWISKGRYSKLLELWVRGLNCDWNKLYGDIKPHRVSLPTYPFAREHYWIPEVVTNNSANNGDGVAFIHPLLHRNTSDFAEQKFSSTFTGKEFFWAEHLVKGQKLLLETAHLEMAREAFMQASGIQSEWQKELVIKNVVWTTPIVVGEKHVDVHIGLIPQDNGETDFNIYSDMDGNKEEVIVHSHGRIMSVEPEGTRKLDIEALQAACSRNILASARCYEMLREKGIDCGPSYKIIDLLYLGEDEALAKLVLPTPAGEFSDKFVLHPALLASAIQASAVFMSERDGTLLANPLLPVELQELRIFDVCSSEMWSHIRFSKDCSMENKVKKLDIELCDGQGKICVRMKACLLGKPVYETYYDKGLSPVDTLMYEPCWERAAITDVKDDRPEFEEHMVFLCGYKGINGRDV
jgi:polyketide synthase PksN